MHVKEAWSLVQMALLKESEKFGKQDKNPKLEGRYCKS